MAFGPGSIAFTGFNSDGSGNLAFMTTESIPAGTVIHFTNNAWLGDSFGEDGDTLSWTVTEDVAAGSVVTLDNLNSDAPTSSSGSLALAEGSSSLDVGAGFLDEVYAYVGEPDTPTAFLAGIGNFQVSTDGNGLTLGQTALNIPLASAIAIGDVAVYSGPTSGFPSFTDYLAAINNPSNWTVQGGTGDESQDGVAPDVPFTTEPFAVDPTAQVVTFAPESLVQETAEGDEGTTELSFVVQRSNGTTGDLDFTGRFDFDFSDSFPPMAGAADDDFGGTLPTFSGTIPDGQDSVVVTVQITGDRTFEPAESFKIILDSAANASTNTVIGGANEALVTIDYDSGDPIAAGEILDQGITLTGDQKVVIEEGGGIVIDAALGNFGTAILLERPGTDLEIDNAGLIEFKNGFGDVIFGDFEDEDHNLTIINRETGVIRNPGNVIEIESDPGTTGHVVLDNYGIIEETLPDGDEPRFKAVDFEKHSSSTLTVYNREGAIMRSGNEVLTLGRTSEGPATVYNDGTIFAYEVIFDSDAVEFGRNDGVFHNGATGYVEGGRHGITGKGPIEITNAEGGQIIGRNGSGINMDSGFAAITNHGLISGRYNGGRDSDGIDVDGVIELDNHGRIETFQPDEREDIFAEGLAIGGGNVRNHEGGEIYSDGRGILADGSNLNPAFAPTSVENAGSIVAKRAEAIKFVGDFDDEIVNSGTITTQSSEGIAIDMGSGNDLLKVTGEGTIEGQALGGAGDDTLEGGSAEDDFHGGEGDDQLDGGFGEDTLTGGEGDDTLEGGFGDDSLDGGEGDDDLAGGWGDDAVIGSEGEDLIEGGWDDDMLVGGEGDDFLIGGWGDDTLEGGAGDDRLEGKRGNDAFLFRGEFGDDLIVDYDEGEVIILEGYGLAFEELAISETDEGTLVAVEGGGSIFVEDAFNLGQDSFQLI